MCVLTPYSQIQWHPKSSNNKKNIYMWLNVIYTKLILSQYIQYDLWGGLKGLPCHVPAC